MTTHRTWSVGQLAARTGISVRTLHHYDAIGLLVASQRTDAGHRRYSLGDVERLYRIRALRELGLGLAQVDAALHAEPTDLVDVLSSHLARIERDIDDAAQLRDRLVRVVESARDGIGQDDLLTIIEGMTRMERHFTPDQLEELASRREQLGDDGMRAAEDAWTGIATRLRAHMEQGDDPAGPELRDVALEARGLIDQFTGGDPEMAASLDSLRAEWHETGASHPDMERTGWDADLSRYMARVLDAHR